MKAEFENINRVLADWNPISVDEEIAIDEYKAYIPSLYRVIDDKDGLMKCLEDILINKMEVGYEPKNKEHLEDLQKVCNKLFKVHLKTKSLD